MNPGDMVDDSRLLKLPNYMDSRGRLAWLQRPILPFEVRRVYFLDSSATGVVRAEHGHVALRQVLVALGGELTVDVTSPSDHTKSYRLLPFDSALYIPGGCWRSVTFWSEGATCLVLASQEFDEHDYIRDQGAFREWAGWK